jgi:hypothetical protein
VPIKDEKLIGQKVECPKCKYRFKVEEPAGGVPKGDDKADKKKKKAATPGDAKQKKKTVAIVVGVLAVCVLAAVGYAVIGGGGSSSKPITQRPPGPAPGPGPGPVDGPGPDGTGDPKKDDTKKGPKQPPKPKGVLKPSDKETTNLLPGDTIALARVDVERIRHTPLTPLFAPAMAGMFKQSFGVDVEQVAVYYHALVGPGREPFGVIRLNETLAEKDVVKGMAPAGSPKAVAGKTRKSSHNLYAFKSNPFANGISHALSFTSLFGEFYDKVPVKDSKTKRAVGLCVYDTQHVLVGDYAVLEKFLASLDDTGYPPLKSGVGSPPEGIVRAEYPMYLSLDPKMKQLLKDLGTESPEVPLVVYAERYTPGTYDPKALKADLAPVTALLDPVLSRADYLGGNLTSFTSRQLAGTVRVVMKTPTAAFEVMKDPLTPGLTTAAQALTLFLNSPVEFRNLNAGGGATMPGGGTPVDPMNPMMGGMGPGILPPGMGGGSSLGPPPMAGGGSSLGPPPMAGGGSSLGPPPGMGGGSSLGPPPIGGGMLPGMGPGMPPVPGMGTPPTDPKVEQPAALSRIDLRMVDENISIAFEINWTAETFRNKLEPRLMGIAGTLKGKMAVFTSDLSYHALSQAVPRMTAATGGFPRGTADRKLTDASRYGLKYRPETRVSFFAELLPFIGRDGLGRTINRDLAWFEPGNLDAAEAWVPELLVPTYPHSAWRATWPDLPGRVFGGTNYVAIAGVGLDIAREDPAADEFKAKVGITGYDWGSKVDEVADGLPHTIYLMQTPPGLSQPWMAGGGATVRGLNPADPMRGFVHMFGTPDGKPGTFALMGDGSVRFIPADIKPDLLLAMATRAGGEAFVADRIDKETVLVFDPKKKPEPKPEPKEDEDPEPKAGSLEAAPAPREKGK